ncbi:aconitase/3-isopropylmalate dehydratase large subunit family protein [bacterium]
MKRKKCMTITEKILAKHAGKDHVTPGEVVWVDVDVLMTHDVCGPGTIGIFKKEFGEDAKVWDKEKVVIIPDHYIFTEDPYAKRNIEILRNFALEQELPHYFDVDTERYQGVCHVALAELGFDRPGQVMFGTDSHTCTGGAFGQFATGIGNTDAGFILGTGKLWVKVPATKRFILEDPLPSYVMAKDVILRIIGDLGVDGATYNSIEFQGEALVGMNMEERMTLCNMVIEAGAKSGIIAPDETTLDYMQLKSELEVTSIASDPEADFGSTTVYRSRNLEPVVAQPFAPDRVVPAYKLKNVALDQCYIGSCTGGKMTDFIAAAKILKNRTVKIKTKIVPATVKVDKALSSTQLDNASLKEIFINAGAEIGPPSCAACLGGPEDTFGRLKGGEVCLSTTNRNFPGRMGSPKSRTYLASPLTVAASAITGRITDPRDYLTD